MATNVLCGRCGAPLASASATCTNCGSAPASGARSYSRHNPWAAAALSIIPGLGHIYVGHWKKGLVYMALAGGLEFLGFDLDLTAIGLAVGIPMELGGLGIWAHAAWDAYHIAKRGY
jgi:ribosomal protein L37E